VVLGVTQWTGEVLMNWEAVSAVAESLGAIAVVLSLLYVGYQVRQNTRQERVAAHRPMVAELGRALDVVAQDAEIADLFLRGSQGYARLSVSDKVRFSCYMGRLFRLFEQLYHEHLDGALDDMIWTGIQNAIRDLNAPPGVQEWWSTRSHWASPAFANFLRTPAAAEPKELYGQHVPMDRS
jgi:hypothetical protein